MLRRGIADLPSEQQQQPAAAQQAQLNSPNNAIPAAERQFGQNTQMSQPASSINGSYCPPNPSDSINSSNNRNDDHFYRAESLQQRSPEPTPWDANTNAGADLPEWRQYGFESEEAYRAELHQQRIREQLDAYRQG